MCQNPGMKQKTRSRKDEKTRARGESQTVLHDQSQASGLSALDRQVIHDAFIALCDYMRRLAIINASAPSDSRVSEVLSEWEHTTRRLGKLFGQRHGEVSDGERGG